MGYKKFIQANFTPPVRERFLLNLDPHNIFILERSCKAGHQYILHGFVWESTPEGEKYWRSMYDDYYRRGI